MFERDGGLEIRATDGSGRGRETEFRYPETPLGNDNLPAVLAGLNDEILYGVDARFVLLSSGVDRWRAALIERDELEGVRDRYGDRIPVFDRPLLPEYGIDAYGSWTGGEPEGEHGSGGDSEAGPWPAWALERVRRSTSTNVNTNANTNSSESANTDSTAGLIEEAEPDRSGPESRSRRETAETVVSRRERRETDTDGFGTLSGRTKTARVTNDSFGADVETPTDDDRYRALGAAIGTGEDVSVKGLLDDDEFLPELPAAEPVETRIEFEDEFDPTAVSKAKATAEESGFEWVQSGPLETTRIR